ncbi:MAG: ABC transporter permease [Pseudonocardiales bacterium]|nr:ABC transporter permease [Pseudonocardiales bacterium]
MGLAEAVHIALRAVRAHRLRSALTMLGLIIGVSAVILLVAVGNGVQKSIDARIQPLASLIILVPTTGNVPGGPLPKNLTDADVAALQKAPDIAAITPEVTGPFLIKTVTTESTAQSQGTVVGSTEHWLEVNARDILVGSFFDQDQVRSAARVVVLGPALLTNLFDGDPVAALTSSVQINRQTFKVIGVLQPAGFPTDNDVIMPLSTARNFVFGHSDLVNRATVHAVSAAAVPAAEQQMNTILDARHQIKNPATRDFQSQSLTAAVATSNQILKILTMFTAAVATISLVVGAIGVLNIMLVSVTERTREIGIRKAIGATNRAILHQFLTESIVLSGLGGLIGVGTGVGLSGLGGLITPTFASYLGSTFADFTPVVTVGPIIASFAISLTIGLIAGGYPAYRAVRLRPVEALRYQ